MLHAKGPLLTVDVGERTSTRTDIDSLLEEFVGGRALATALAHDRIPFDADPLGPQNRAYLSTGPLQQSQMSFTGRMNMTGLSPLTDGLVSTNAGGYLSRNFTKSGISVLEVVGESDEPLLLHVTDEGVEFEAVPELEGALVPEVSEYVEETRDLGPENCITIGPAGENLVRFASVMTFDSRAFGRGGLGAVLGSKNVKGVTFSGDAELPVEIPDPPEMDIHREAATSDDIRRRQGTTAGTAVKSEVFSLPTRYFKEQSFEDVENIDGDAIESKKYKKGSCSACAYACKLPLRDEESGVETEGPEFETLYSFGSNQGVGDLVEIMKANELCDTLGMDTISAGVTVAAYLATAVTANSVSRTGRSKVSSSRPTTGVSFTARGSRMPSPTAGRTTCTRSCCGSSTTATSKHRVPSARRRRWSKWRTTRRSAIPASSVRSATATSPTNGSKRSSMRTTKNCSRSARRR